MKTILLFIGESVQGTPKELDHLAIVIVAMYIIFIGFALLMNDILTSKNPPPL